MVLTDTEIQAFHDEGYLVFEHPEGMRPGAFGKLIDPCEEF